MSLFARQDESVSLDDFLEMEINAPESEKWELLGGVLWRSMAGGTAAHNVIVQNVASALRAKLRAKGSPCRPFTENLKVVRRELALAAYPDIVVDCGPFDPNATQVSDPVLLVEVLSVGSRAKDIGEKGPLYRRIPSVKLILFIGQTTPEIEIYEGKGERFEVSRLEGTAADISLDALGVTLTMAEIYRDLFD